VEFAVLKLSQGSNALQNAADAVPEDVLAPLKFKMRYLERLVDDIRNTKDDTSIKVMLGSYTPMLQSASEDVTKEISAAHSNPLYMMRKYPEIGEHVQVRMTGAIGKVIDRQGDYLPFKVELPDMSKDWFSADDLKPFLKEVGAAPGVAPRHEHLHAQEEEAEHPKQEEQDEQEQEEERPVSQGWPQGQLLPPQGQPPRQEGLGEQEQEEERREPRGEPQEQILPPQEQPPQQEPPQERPALQQETAPPPAPRAVHSRLWKEAPRS
jgi:hypothetical protein